MDSEKINLATILWLTLVITIMNPRVPLKCGDVLMTELLLSLQEGLCSTELNGFSNPLVVCGIE
jgi:hypothetical protein